MRSYSNKHTYKLQIRSWGCLCLWRKSGHNQIWVSEWKRRDSGWGDLCILVSLLCGALRLACWIWECKDNGLLQSTMQPIFEMSDGGVGWQSHPFCKPWQKYLWKKLRNWWWRHTSWYEAISSSASLVKVPPRPDVPMSTVGFKACSSSIHACPKQCTLGHKM